MKHKSILSALLLTVILSLAIIPQASSQPVTPEPLVLAETQAKHPYATDHVLVKLQPGAQLASSTEGTSLNALYANLGVRSTQAVFADGTAEQVMRLNLAANSDIEATVARLEQNPNVLWAEPDYLAYAADTTPNDPQFASQWGLTQIDAPAAWDVVTGTQGTVIAVLDSGIDLTHEDLASKLWVNPGEVADNGIDDDNNGFIDDINGWDFVGDDSDPSDDHGHGTQVAGIAAAITDNATGMAGVCWGCRIMPVKVMQISGAANYSDVAAGVIYAAKKGVDVMNLSLGAYSYSSTLHDAIQSAVNDYGVVVVAGAGNNDTSDMFYPAAHEEVLAVAGADTSDVKVNTSNYGAWVDVSAPGEDITSSFMGGGYGAVSGTSYAAPFVAGLAGLLHGQNPSWSPAMIQKQIVHTTDNVDSVNPTHSGMLGSGRVNADSAVTTTPSPMLSISETMVDSEVPGHPTAGVESELVLTVSNDWLDANNLQGTLLSSDPKVTISQNYASFGDVSTGESASNTTAYKFTVDTSAGYSYDIAFTLRLRANNGAYVRDIPFIITTRDANQEVSGTLTANTVWTSDKTYIVNGDIAVAHNVTLTIEPGTQILFDGSYNLNVGGTLIAKGTLEAPIKFDVMNGVTNWNQINFMDSAIDASVDINDTYIGGNILEYVEIQQATGGVRCTDATPYLNYITMPNSQLICTPGSLHKDGAVYTDTLLLANSFIGSEVTINGIGYVSDSIFEAGLNQQSGMVINNTFKNSGTQFAAGTTIENNTFSNIQGNWAIRSSDYISITNNRFVDNDKNIYLEAQGLIQGNLIANGGLGITIEGAVDVISNTFTGNNDTSLQLSGNPTGAVITNNNFELNTSTYDIVNQVAYSTISLISAPNNWWGTTDSVQIGQRIYDYMDGNLNISEIDYVPAAIKPAPDAPAYVRQVTMTPASPVGIETGTFEVEFSRDMIADNSLHMSFNSTSHHTWELFTVSNSGLAGANIQSALEVGPQNSVWCGTENSGVSIRREDGTWYTIDTSNSDLPDNHVNAIAFDLNGSAWIGTMQYGVLVIHPDGTSQVYDETNSALTMDYLRTIAVDDNGNIWFGGSINSIQSGLLVVYRTDGTWESWDKTNSPIEHSSISVIDIDQDNDVWFGSHSFGLGVYHNDGTWGRYMPPIGDSVFALKIDTGGNIWTTSPNYVNIFQTNETWKTLWPGGQEIGDLEFDDSGSVWLASFDGIAYELTPDNIWIKHNSLLTYGIYEVAEDYNGNLWFGGNGGVSVYKNKPVFNMSNAFLNWPDSSTLVNSYDFSTLLPKDFYNLTISGAIGADGIEVAPYSDFTFIFDYVSVIGVDTTPPSKPGVIAWASGNNDVLTAVWGAGDEDGEIDLYRYAIGTSPDGTEISGWTTTTATTLTRSLMMLPGQTYYVSVQARNTGGIWSAVGTNAGLVPGCESCLIHLPMSMKNN